MKEKKLFEVKLVAKSDSRIVYIISSNVINAENKAMKLFPYYVVQYVTFHTFIY